MKIARFQLIKINLTPHLAYRVLIIESLLNKVPQTDLTAVFHVLLEATIIILASSLVNYVLRIHTNQTKEQLNAITVLQIAKVTQLEPNPPMIVYMRTIARLIRHPGNLSA